MKRDHWVVSVFVLLAAAGRTTGGPVWCETPRDAGKLPSTSSVTLGSGTLSGIMGELGTAALAGADTEDMYVIRICAPAQFLASTFPPDGGNANFNTQLWLFRPVPPGPPINARGLLANDDVNVPNGPLQSRLPSQSNDGSGAAVMTPGIYFLAISVFNSDPQSPRGLIFNQAVPTETSGPDGPGGALPIVDWTGGEEPAAGSYLIALQGVRFALSNCPADTEASGTVDVLDLTNVILDWGSPGLSHGGDVNCDGTVNVQDLLEVIGGWGPCPGGSACPGQGDCSVPNGTPGCSDAACCATICVVDPFCCESQWDQVCADEATMLCGGATITD